MDVAIMILTGMAIIQALVLEEKESDKKQITKNKKAA